MTGRARVALLPELLTSASRAPPVLTETHCRMTGSIVLMISYGYEPQEDDDPLIRMADEATEQAAEVAQPGAFIVDVFPFRKCLASGQTRSSG